MAIRTLVLSGGGGRGAFHAGVYSYLMKRDKPGVADSHSGPWDPQIVVGTSIGAVNGAAITQGIRPEALEQFWLSLTEQDIQGLPPGMGWLARRVANMILRPAIGTSLPHVKENSMSPPVSQSWPPIPVLPRGISERLIGRWSNLLDTGPLHRTMVERLGIDEAEIADSDKVLLISATNVRTGEAVIFSNRDVIDPRTQQTYDYCKPKITTRRIIASCSIPMMYPWTQDEDGAIYWDGAVVANTPLGPAFDVMENEDQTNGKDKKEPVEAVVVMMTPWWESGERAPECDDLPQDFGEAITWTLDWALLASFRRDLKLARAYNKVAKMAMSAGDDPDFRLFNDIIVAPEKFLDVTRIIDYDREGSEKLIKAGYEAAERAFQRQFPAT